MRKLLFMAVFLLIAGPASASLIDQGDGTVWDNTAGLLWYQDLTDFVDQTYGEQIASIGALSGDGWRMATDSDIDLLLDNSYQEIDASFTNTRYSSGGSYEYYYYYGRYDKVPDGYVNMHSMMLVRWDTVSATGIDNLSNYLDSSSNDRTGAWVVKDFSAVPTPAAIWLLGSGLLGLVGVRKKLKK